MAELVCPAADRDKWLAARREGITATDIVTIMGLVSWDSPWALYHRKKGLLPEVEQSDRMRLGNWLEARIAGEWETQENETSDPGGLYCSSVRPWQLATPDRIVSRWPARPAGVTSLLTGIGSVRGLLGEAEHAQREAVAVLECKTADIHQEGWGDDGTGQVPAHVRAQVLWQMDTLDVSTGHVAVVFLPSGEFRSYTISHEGIPDHWEPNIANWDRTPCDICRDIGQMRMAGFEFLNRLNQDNMPPLDGSQPTLDAVKHLNASVVKGTKTEIDELLAFDYLASCQQLSGAKKIKAECEARLRQAMGDGQLASVRGEVFARREVFKRAESVTRAHEVDRLVRVKPKETGNE